MLYLPDFITSSRLTKRSSTYEAGETCEAGENGEMDGRTDGRIGIDLEWLPPLKKARGILEISKINLNN